MKRRKTETDISGKTKPGVEPFRFFCGGGVTGGFGFQLVSTIFATKLISRNVEQRNAGECAEGLKEKCSNYVTCSLLVSDMAVSLYPALFEMKKTGNVKGENRKMTKGDSIKFLY